MSEVRFQLEPLAGWDKPKTEMRKGSHTFKAAWDDTLSLLKAEVDMLGSLLAVVQIDVQRGDIRRDGMLKVGAKVGFPGVKVSFESNHGSLTYATDVYEKQYGWAMPGWQANVRAIALGLQALRAVDRYGITRSGEQYRGFTALSDKPAGHDELTVADAVLVFGDALGRSFTLADLSTKDAIGIHFRAAARGHHPDAGGSDQVFQLITKARDVLLRSVR